MPYSKRVNRSSPIKLYFKNPEDGMGVLRNCFLRSKVSQSLTWQHSRLSLRERA